MKKMSLFTGASKGIDILDILHKLDNRLTSPGRIVLCGSAVPILLGCEFRGTQDIDFALLPQDHITHLIQNTPSLSSYFDFQAQGVIGLLIDFEDRDIKVPGFHYLEVEHLSLLGWVVSKLASPKLEDVLNVSEVDKGMLLDILNRFDEYGGISFERARRDLEYLIKQF